MNTRTAYVLKNTNPFRDCPCKAEDGSTYIPLWLRADYVRRANSSFECIMSTNDLTHALALFDVDFADEVATLLTKEYGVDGIWFTDRGGTYPICGKELYAKYAPTFEVVKAKITMELDDET